MNLPAFSFCPAPKYKPLSERISPAGENGAIFPHLVHGESVPDTSMTEVESKKLPGKQQDHGNSQSGVSKLL